VAEVGCLEMRRQRACRGKPPCRGKPSINGRAILGLQFTPKDRTFLKIETVPAGLLLSVAYGPYGKREPAHAQRHTHPNSQNLLQ
jgi:hypothetical protein